MFSFFGNPKTTTLGYILVIVSAMQILAKGLQGTLDANDLQGLFQAATGVGLIMAKDGGQ